MERKYGCGLQNAIYKGQCKEKKYTFRFYFFMILLQAMSMQSLYTRTQLLNSKKCNDMVGLL